MGDDRSPIRPAPAPNVKLAVEATTNGSGPESDLIGRDGLPCDYAFDLNFVDSRGRVWAGAFKAHVLTIMERGQAGLTRARLLNGLPVQAVDPYTLQLLDMQAWLAVAIDAAPEWAKNMQDLRDPQVVEAIYKEVVGYEERYFRTGAKT